MKIEFVSYKAHQTALCEGVLTLKINDEKKTFGNNGKTDYPYFWRTGGHAIIFSGIKKAPWIADEYASKRFPEDLQKHLPELLKVFNANVPHGCCGGCLLI